LIVQQFNKKVDMIKIIETQEDYKKALSQIEVYLSKGFENLLESETNELQRLSLLVEKYESIHYPIPFKPRTISELIKMIMIEKNLKQKELAAILEITTTRLSEILNGKRKINLDLAKRLHKSLKIDANFLLESL
jgi:HTH-type transcriptional regulator/antitoxin HigA